MWVRTCDRGSQGYRGVRPILEAWIWQTCAAWRLLRVEKPGFGPWCAIELGRDRLRARSGLDTTLPDACLAYFRGNIGVEKPPRCNTQCECYSPARRQPKK